MNDVAKIAAARAIVHEDGLHALADKYYGKIMRMWHIKKMFTPYEQDKKFIDQTIYEDDVAEHVFITGFYQINNRVLVEYVSVDCFDTDYIAPDGRIICPLYDVGVTDFAFLDAISLAYYKNDTDEFLTDGIICLTPNDIPEGSYIINEDSPDER